MWYSYVLQSKKNARLYVGVTDDLRRRFKEHNSGQGGKYTKDNGPFKLIFYEAHINKLDAYKSEKFFKSGYGKEVLKDKLENYFKDYFIEFSLARSSNGRTWAFEAQYLGSNPSLAGLNSIKFCASSAHPPERRRI